jgi:hypothetical protein
MGNQGWVYGHFSLRRFGINEDPFVRILFPNRLPIFEKEGALPEKSWIKIIR